MFVERQLYEQAEHHGPEAADHAAGPCGSLRIPGFTLTEGVHPGGSALPWHSHDGPTICYVLRGSFTEVSAGERLTCSPGTLKVMPAGERHCDEFDRGDARGLLIEADPAPRRRPPGPLSRVLDERVAMHGGLPGVIARRLYQEFRAGDDAAPLAVEGLLLELLAAAARESAPARRSADPPWLADVRDLIHAAPDHGSRLARPARRARSGCTRRTLARSFRGSRSAAAWGTTCGGCGSSGRPSSSGASELPLAAIALGAGFSDQSHFSNVFRRLTGMSPSAYRRDSPRRALGQPHPLQQSRAKRGSPAPDPVPAPSLR